MKTEEDFIKILCAIADHCGYDLKHEMSIRMAESLQHIGWDKVCDELETYIEVIEPIRSNFPTIAKIRQMCGEEFFSDEDMARDIAENIFRAISRLGSYAKIDEVKAFVGDVGFAVIQRNGGWVELARSCTMENCGMLKAQWRELAKVLIKKDRAGLGFDGEIPSRNNVRHISEAINGILKSGSVKVIK